jgi:hypothetical protein
LMLFCLDLFRHTLSFFILWFNFHKHTRFHRFCVYYSPPGKFFPPFLQMSLRGRSSRSNPRLQWETASFLAVTSHLDYWKKLFWTAIARRIFALISPASFLSNEETSLFARRFFSSSPLTMSLAV